MEALLKDGIFKHNGDPETKDNELIVARRSKRFKIGIQETILPPVYAVDILEEQAFDTTSKDALEVPRVEKTPEETSFK